MNSFHCCCFAVFSDFLQLSRPDTILFASLPGYFLPSLLLHLFENYFLLRLFVHEFFRLRSGQFSIFLRQFRLGQGDLSLYSIVALVDVRGS